MVARPASPPGEGSPQIGFARVMARKARYPEILAVSSRGE